MKSAILTAQTPQAALAERARMPFMPKAGSPRGQSSASSTSPGHATTAPRVGITDDDHPLAPWLNWLDQRLRLALGVTRGLVGDESIRDSYRGLYITPNEVDRLLAQPAGQPLFAGLGAAAVPVGPLPAAFDRLATAIGLTPFDIAAVLLAVAPELDLRYERLYAFLQDDVSRKRPSVDLALNLLCGSTEEKLRMRARFLPSAPLLRYGLLQLLPESGQTAVPFAIHIIKPDTQVVAALLGETSIDARLGACARVHATTPAADAGLAQQHWGLPMAALVQAARLAVAGEVPLRCHFHGPDALALQALADTLGVASQQAVLHLDLAQLKQLAQAQAPHERIFSAMLGAALRHAWLHGAIVCFDNVDVLYAADSAMELCALLDHLSYPATVCLLTGTEARNFGGGTDTGMLSLSVPAPTRASRQHAWHAELGRHSLSVDAAATLAARFQLNSSQTRDAVRAVASQLRLKPMATTAAQDLDGLLFAAARLQTRHVFAGLAQLIEPRHSWADLILPADTLAQLHEITSRFLHQDQVLGEWGFASKLGYGTGTTVLFAGPSGTGKTMAAEVLAHALGLDLYRIDLAAVVSKYIGETEKNLDRLFTAAAQANAVLFFDEADALFGKRTEVKDSHDRYANLEISYLLQKMEQYQGIAILASNLRQNLDDAFVRRLAFIVHFPFPDEVQRRRIWNGVWPSGMCLADDVNMDELAQELKLSGGNIKNVALAAAFLAAQDGTNVTRHHIRCAAEREFQKLGRSNSMSMPVS
ncbi:ATP-binding protein [Undibacterium sp. JH2W]|uniref:ATP-binding protein n=1 Tax=Undibacterium sp. JH2W TaxID=3413037 RepID=UPI003BF35468